MSITRICFVRHGETDWNAERRMQGHIDIPLNAAGINQAKRLAKALIQTHHSFDAIYASDLQRAHATAQLIAEAFSQDVMIHQNLRERHVGQLQGLLLDEAPQRVPLCGSVIWPANWSMTSRVARALCNFMRVCALS